MDSEFWYEDFFESCHWWDGQVART